MAEPKKSSVKPIMDVAHPGKSAPSPNSKSVIVTHRPLMPDPMMVSDSESTKTADESKTEKEKVATAPSKGHLNIQPLSAPLIEKDTTEQTPETVTEESPEPAVESTIAPDESDNKSESEASAEMAQTATPSPEPKPVESSTDQVTTTVDKQLTPLEATEAEAVKQTEHDATIQKLVDGKKYFLPINSVEKRRTKRVVILGIALSLVLAIAWVDIALDAGLIELGNIQPVTHFFSN